MSTAPRHILVAEDDAPLRGLLTEVLADTGLRVTTARGGDEVLSALNRDAPDLVLLDVHIPRLEATAFAIAWQSAAPADARVVVVSGLSDIPEPLRTLSAATPIIKPFDLDELLHVVASQCPQLQPN